MAVNHNDEPRKLVRPGRHTDPVGHPSAHQPAAAQQATAGAMDWLPKEKAEASDDVWSGNRVMLTHFDDYSTALVFAKWGGTLLFPAPLPASAASTPAPADVAAAHDGETVKTAIVAGLGLNADELAVTEAFQHWALADEGLIRVHLLRFNTFEAPKAALEPHGAVFQPISALRGCDKLELALAREVFNLIMGAGGGRT